MDDSIQLKSPLSRLPPKKENPDRIGETRVPHVVGSLPFNMFKLITASTLKNKKKPSSFFQYIFNVLSHLSFQIMHHKRSGICSPAVLAQLQRNLAPMPRNPLPLILLLPGPPLFYSASLQALGKLPLSAPLESGSRGRSIQTSLALTSTIFFKSYSPKCDWDLSSSCAGVLRTDVQLPGVPFPASVPEGSSEAHPS